MAELAFNDTTNYLGVIQACERKLFNSNYGRISGDSTLLADFTARANAGMSWVTETIFDADTRWQWDDSNHTTFPEFTTDLADDQKDYRLDVEMIKLLGVSILKDGEYYALLPIDPNDTAQPLDSVFDTKGLPKYYDKYADAVRVFPAPDTTLVTATNGIKVYTQRTPDYFTSADTTQKPGVPSLFHEAVADYASWTYADDNDMESKELRFRGKLFGDNRNVGWEQRIKNYYAKRDVDDRPRMTVSRGRRLNILR